MKKIMRILIIGAIFSILYGFVGHGFVEFYFGGKIEMLETAAYINKLSNANGKCPMTLEGWQREAGGLTKGRMLYLVPPVQVSEKNTGRSIEPQSFRLIYRMAFPPDHWFEVKGGVGKEVTSGWESR